MAAFRTGGDAAILSWLAVPVLLARATAPKLTAPLVAALPNETVLLICGAGTAAAVLFLLPLRLPEK